MIAAPRRAALLRRAGLWTLGWVGLAVVMLVWQIVAEVKRSALFPTFTATVAELWQMLSSSFVTADLLPSVGRLLIGFAASAVIGIVVGLFTGYYRVVREWTAAFFDFSRSLPTPLLIPVALVLFGLGGTMVVVIIASAAIWPVLINTANATAALEPTLVDTARCLGLRGPRLLAKVILPAVSPQIFAGLRVGISVSLAVLVVAEILGGSSGIGFFISSAQQSFQITASYAGVLVLCMIGWIADSVFLLVERRLLRWQRGIVGGGRD
jgi:ABC-type nitrate/sulfonate/bicarbonate transport system permease component